MTHRTALLFACVLMLWGTASNMLAQQMPAETPMAAAHPRTLDLRRMQPISGDAQAGAAKAAVCAACHGAQGVGVARNFPNLAGQSATYLYVQLREFHAGERNDPVMTAQAAALTDADMRDLASHYASLGQKPAGLADVDSRGAQLYLAGDPAEGIPPCQGCHGPTANGPQPQPSSAPQPPWSTFPHLRGQSALYIAKQLGDYRSGARAGSSNARVMQGVAQTLGDEDVQALATYLSTR